VLLVKVLLITVLNVKISEWLNQNVSVQPDTSMMECTQNVTNVPLNVKNVSLVPTIVKNVPVTDKLKLQLVYVI